jgi:hypothetical protein
MVMEMETGRETRYSMQRSKKENYDQLTLGGARRE